MQTPIAIKTPFIDPDKALPEVEKMLFDLAWKTANTYPVTFEEAKTEAYYAFVRACHDYSPEKSKGSKFSTWCYFWVWTHLKTFVTKRTVDPLVFVEIDDDLAGAAPEDNSFNHSPLEGLSDDLVRGLSADAKEIMSLLIETPAEILGGVPVPVTRLLGKVKNHLVSSGYCVDRFNAARTEIETRLLALQAN